MDNFECKERHWANPNHLEKNSNADRLQTPFKLTLSEINTFKIMTLFAIRWISKTTIGLTTEIFFGEKNLRRKSIRNDWSYRFHIVDPKILVYKHNPHPLLALDKFLHSDIILGCRLLDSDFLLQLEKFSFTQFSYPLKLTNGWFTK